MTNFNDRESKHAEPYAEVGDGGERSQAPSPHSNSCKEMAQTLFSPMYSSLWSISFAAIPDDLPHTPPRQAQAHPTPRSYSLSPEP